MTDSIPLQNPQTRTEQEVYSKTLFGFWVYIMTDCVLFATLFTVYAVLHNNTYGGPSAHTLFSLPYALAETLILLTSSFTCGIAIMQYKEKKQILAWLIPTFLLGAAFLVLEFREFHRLVTEGNSWQRSGFLTSFFTLVGTHGLHVTTGLLWMGVLMVQLLRRGLTPVIFKRLSCLRLFWHFLDVVWIFIFTLVYLLAGASPP